MQNKIDKIFLKFFHIQNWSVLTHLWHIHVYMSNTMLSSGLLLFHVNNVFSMLNHCIIFYYYLKYQLNSTLVLPTTDIANRVTKLYPSSVQIYTIFMWPVQHMVANQEPLMGRCTLISGMLQGKKHIQLRTNEKGIFYIFFLLDCFI